MPFPVESLIEGRPFPLTIAMEEPITRALDLMVEHDFSQLPVVAEDRRPIGMITYEGILQGVRNFRANLDDLHVRDVMSGAKVFNLEDDLFDLLEELKRTYAVLIGDANGCLAGIVTSYDSTEFFRGRSEDLMLVEDIEVTIKEFIQLAYMRDDQTLDQARLDRAIAGVSQGTKGDGSSKPLAFDQLSLGQYVTMLISRNTWSFFDPIFHIPRDSVRKLLEDIRDTRNSLAHFRNEISANQKKQLRWCADWLARCREEYDRARTQELFRRLAQPSDQTVQTTVSIREPRAEHTVGPVSGDLDASEGEVRQEIVGMIAEESSPMDSRYAPLADWLLSRPGKVDTVALSFDEVETIIGGELPASARNHRAWWANDAQSHPHSRLWLEAGWRRSSLNMTEGRVSFTRIREREKAYIDFFSKLLADLRQRASFPIKDTSPDGASWAVCASVSAPGGSAGQFTYSFARGQRFRVELYLDTYEQESTKAVYDWIRAQKSDLEAKIGAITWERIDNKRASRIAQYHTGSIMDDAAALADLHAWAVDTMIAFYETLEPVAAQAFKEVLGT